jgi:phage shock protein PspC (stress-responsive transcriptional regulator)
MTETQSPPQPLAARYGLVRPRQGRYVGGVCAAIGRATNTDPVLWRVLLAVTSFFGIGLLLYLAGWLLIPGEGDTASPLEGLFGRGRSSTNPLLVILLGVLAVIVLGYMLADGYRGPLLVVGGVLGGVLLLGRKAHAEPPTMATPPPAPPPVPSAAPPFSAAYAPPVSSAPPMPPAPPAPPGYRPPFAPHGPYAGGPPPAPPYPPAGQRPKPPRPPRERSKLGLLTLSGMLLVLGLVAGLDLTTAWDIEASGYFAALLAVVAAGLLLGAWVGRARWLIAVGLLLALGLGIASVGERVNWDASQVGGDTTWRPATVANLQDRYEKDFGTGELDLRQIDFTGQDRTIDVELNAGNMQVILPPNVDTTVQVEVNAGNAKAFGSSWDGFSSSGDTVTDLGADGPGGGKLRINLEINAGNAEVHR